MGSVPLVAGCDTTERTIRRGMSAVAITSVPVGVGRKRFTLFGIAPDGIEEATISDGRRQIARVPVIDNAYTYRAPKMIYGRVLRS